MAAGKLTKKACVCIFLALIFFGCALATSFIAFRSFWYHDDYKSDTVQIDVSLGNRICFGICHVHLMN